MNYIASKSKVQTQKIAIRLFKKIQKAKCCALNAIVIALSGDLGSGKTVFVQGFVKAFGIKTHIPSPTFVIYRKYQISCKLKVKSCKFTNVYHFDLYRIQKLKEIIDLDFSAGSGPASGWKKLIANPENIVLIEWPEKIKKILPKNTIWIYFEHGKNKKERILRIKNL